jgi:hypothetical protein
LIFYACNVIVSIFISFALCCAPLRVRLYFHLILLCMYVFTAFKWPFVSCFHMLVNLFIVCYCAAFERGTVGDVSYAKVLQGISFCLFRWWSCHVPILRSPWHFVVFVSFEMSCDTISWFCLALCLFGASFALNRSCLRFHDFCLAPSLLGGLVPSRTLLFSLLWYLLSP